MIFESRLNRAGRAEGSREMFLVLNVQKVWISSLIRGKGPEAGTYFGLQFIFLCFPFPNSNKPNFFFGWCCSIQGWDFSGISSLGWMWVVPETSGDAGVIQILGNSFLISLLKKNKASGLKSENLIIWNCCWIPQKWGENHTIKFKNVGC